MGRAQQTSHPFDMNEYFSGQRTVLGGRDYDMEETIPETSNKSEPTEKKIIREIRDILKTINGIDLYY